MVAARSQPLTFISYSRADSNFALELAKELRATGFNIWLDQLDIPTGCRWDDEVEKALTQCDIFLVILTPHSIGSNNVKDEIGYAIDSNRRILPILLENAAVPFRLRRFQYVNFTGKNYDEGIEASKQLLQTQVNKLLSTGDWVAVSAQTGGNRLLPKSLVEQQRAPGQAKPVNQDVSNKQTSTSSAKSEKEKSASKSSWTAYIIPILLGLALVSVVCIFAVWVVIDSGKLQFSWLNQNPNAIIANPSPVEDLTATPTSNLVPTGPLTSAPTSTVRPVDTLTFTFTPEPTITQTPIIPTNTPVISADPVKFIIDYFDTVAKYHDLTKGWTMLTSDFQNEGAAGWGSYEKYWNSVSGWEYSNIQVDYTSPPYVRVLISFTLYYYGNTPPSRLNDKHYCLIQANPPEGWKIDLRRRCP